MPEGAGKMRHFCLPNWLMPVLTLGFLSLVFGLGIFVWHSYGLIESYNAQAAELAALKHLSGAQEHQIKIFAGRIDKLNEKMGELNKYESDLAALTGEAQDLLGLDKEASFSELTGNLGQAVAWAKSGPQALGGPEPPRRSGLASLDKVSRENIEAMHQEIDQIMLSASEAEYNISALKENLVSASSILAATPIGLPINKEVTSKFGYRRDPFTGRADSHFGLDIPTAQGTAIYAPANGTVLSADRSLNGYGLLLTIDHGYGLISRYAHLSKALVEPGQEVKRGDKIALSGNTGRSTGPHLHYETILGGVPVDPFKLTYIMGGQDSSESDAVN